MIKFDFKNESVFPILFYNFCIRYIFFFQFIFLYKNYYVDKILYIYRKSETKIFVQIFHCHLFAQR